MRKTFVKVIALILSLLLIAPECMSIVAYAAENNDFTIQDGVLTAYNGPGGDVVIPDGVIKIGDSAFAACNNLTNISLPDGLISIEDFAFVACDNLNNIAFPNSVTSIGNGAFEECSSLKSVSLPSSLISLGEYAFLGCDGLINATTYGNIGKQAFYNCSNLQNVKICGSGNVEETAFRDCSSLKNVEISIVGMIGSWAFGDCQELENLTILPNSVTNIEDMAFYNTKIQTLTIPGSVDTIGEQAFYQCSELVSVKLLDGIKQIGDRAFIECSSLKNISLPNSITSIGRMAFEECSNITTVIIPGSPSIRPSAFNSCTSLTNVFITGSADIGNDAFVNCSSLTDVFIGGSANIGDESFAGCYKLTKASIPNTVTSIGPNAFGGCSILTIYGYKGSYAETYAIDNRIPFSATYTTPASYSIRVEDKISGQPISGISVVYDGNTTVTNSNGIAMLQLSENYISSLTLSKDVSTTQGENSAKAQVTSEYITQTQNNIYLKTNAINNFSVYKKGTQPEDMTFTNPPASNDVLNGPTITFMGKTFPIFKADINMSLPLFGNMQYKCDDEKKTIKVLCGFNGDLSDDEFKSAFEQTSNCVHGLTLGTKSSAWQNIFSNLQKKLVQTKVDAGFSGSANIVAYSEYSYATGEVVMTSGGIIVGGTLGYSAACPTEIPIIYLKFGLDGKLEAKGYLNYEAGNTQSGTGEISLALKGTLGVGAGIDKIANVEGGAKGEVKGTIQMPFHSLQENFKATANMELYLKAQLLLMEAEKSWRFLDLQLYPILQDNPQKSTLAISKNDMHLVPRDYLKSSKSITSLAQSGSGFEKKSVYPYGEPQLTELENGRKLLVWVDDNANRTSENRTEIYYSIESSNGIWSAPTAVSDDKTADFSPRLCKDGEQVYLIWKNATRQFDTGVTLEEMSQSTDIAFSSFDGTQFKSAVDICTAGNTKMETMPRIAANNGNICVTWMENSVDDPFLQDGTNSICRSQYIMGIWQAPQILASGLKPISSLDVGYIESSPIIAYSIDMDANISTTGDSEMFILNGTEQTQLTNDSTDDLGAQFLNGNLYWNAGGMLEEMEGTNTSSIQKTGLKNCPTSFTVLENNGEKAVLWTESNDYVKEAVISYNNSGTWSNPIPVTNYGKDITSMSALLKADGDIEMALDYAAINENASEGESPIGTTDFVVLEKAQNYDTLVEPLATYDIGAVKSGESIPLTVSVSNNSFKSVYNWKLNLQDANGQTISSQTERCYVNPGETEKISIYYTLPETLTHHSVKIVAEPVDIADSDLSNNIATAEFGFADVTVQTVNLEKTENGAIITAKISNNGYDTAENVKADLFNNGVNGTKLDTQLVGSLAVGESKLVTYSLSKDQISISNNLIAKQFYVEAVSDSEDANESNNDMDVLLDNRPEKVVLNKETAQLSAGDNLKITATVEPSDVVNKKVAWLSNNTEVATVDNDGNITAHKAGTALISASAIDGGVTSVCNITVVDSVKSGWIQEGSGWKYYENNEVKTGWLELDGKTYYLDPLNEGYRVFGDFTVGGTLYHFDDDGVLIQNKIVTDIAVITQPVKLSYNAGELLDLMGLAVKISYDDGTEETVAASEFSGKGITTTPTDGTVLTVSDHNNKPVTVSCNGKTAITNNLFVNDVGDRSLISITTPPAITGIVNGTPKTRTALGLPETVMLVTDKGSINANVTWDVSSSSYDESVITKQDFTVNGFITLPTGVLNPNSVELTTTIQITVEAANKTVTGFEALDSAVKVQNVTNGTSLSSLNLPGQLKAIVDGISGVFVKVLEWVSSIDYDPTEPGTYDFSPVLDNSYVLDSGITLPQITVTVGSSEPTEKIITSFDNIELSMKARNVDSGTPMSSLDLPTTLNATVNGATKPLIGLHGHQAPSMILQLWAITLLPRLLGMTMN